LTIISYISVLVVAANMYVDADVIILRRLSQE